MRIKYAATLYRWNGFFFILVFICIQMESVNSFMWCINCALIRRVIRDCSLKTTKFSMVLTRHEIFDIFIQIDSLSGWFQRKCIWLQRVCNAFASCLFYIISHKHTNKLIRTNDKVRIRTYLSSLLLIHRKTIAETCTCTCNCDCYARYGHNGCQ